MASKPNIYVPGICSVSVYPGGFVRVNRLRIPSHLGVSGGVRSNITELSKKSRDKLLFTVGITEVRMLSMITLTYGTLHPMDGLQAKDHLRVFLQAMRREYGLEYAWFIEFQSRGAPHFHVLCNVAEVSAFDRATMAQKWCGAVSDFVFSSAEAIGRDEVWAEGELDKMFSVHTHNRAWENVRSEDGATRYVAKYATKTEQKTVPKQYRNIGRFWGVSSGVRFHTKNVAKMDMSDEELRQLLEAQGHTVAEWDVIPRYIFGFKCFT